MSEHTIDPLQTYLLLEPEGDSVVLPGGGPFWQQLMSGNPTDPGIRRLVDSEHGRLLSAFAMNSDWTNWEMHPAGDELLFMFEGEATFLLELPEGVREVELVAGGLLIVPRGVWHTAKVRAPSRLLAITSGQGTQHRPA